MLSGVVRKHLQRFNSENQQMAQQLGPHLHFGMRINDNYVDPLKYVCIK